MKQINLQIIVVINNRNSNSNFCPFSISISNICIHIPFRNDKIIEIESKKKNRLKNLETLNRYFLSKYIQRIFRDEKNI